MFSVAMSSSTLVSALLQPDQPTIFYVAFHSHAGNDLSVLNARKLRFAHQIIFQSYQPRKDAASQITIHPASKTSQDIQPVFLHIRPTEDHESRHHYGYLITVQSTHQGDYTTKIGRFCAGDATLASYTEITLKCGHKERPEINYPIATGASIQEDSTGVGLLAVVFRRFQSSTENETALCIWSTTEVDALFDEAIRHCFLDNAKERIRWVYGQNMACVKDAKKRVRRCKS